MTVNNYPSRPRTIKVSPGESVEFEASSKSEEIVVTDKAVYYKRGASFPVERYDYSVVLCAFTEISLKPPSIRFEDRYDPGCGDIYDPHCHYSEEVHEPGWAKGSVNLLLRNGKTVTLYSVLLSAKDYNEYLVMSEAVRGELKEILQVFSPHVPCYDEVPGHIKRKMEKMAKEGRSWDEIRQETEKLLERYRQVEKYMKAHPFRVAAEIILFIYLLGTTLLLGMLSLSDPMKTLPLFLLSLALLIITFRYLNKKYGLKSRAGAPSLDS
jgi:hypothetical protein